VHISCCFQCCRGQHWWYQAHDVHHWDPSGPGSPPPSPIFFLLQPPVPSQIVCVCVCVRVYCCS
jgi:hypothetical protein